MPHHARRPIRYENEIEINIRIAAAHAQYRRQLPLASFGSIPITN